MVNSLFYVASILSYMPCSLYYVVGRVTYMASIFSYMIKSFIYRWQQKVQHSWLQVQQLCK